MPQNVPFCCMILLSSVPLSFFVGIAFFVRKGGLSVKTEDFLFCVYRCPLSAQSPLSSVR